MAPQMQHHPQQCSFHGGHEGSGDDNDNDSDKDDDDDGRSSVGTEQALCEMLGLASFEVLVDVDVVEEHQQHADEEPCCCPLPPEMTSDAPEVTSDTTSCSGDIVVEHDTETKPQRASLPPLPAAPHKVHHLRLPRHVSRHFYPSSSCTAYTISNLFTVDECEAFLAATNGGGGHDGGFNYITEATHTLPDGSSHKVKLQNPNPHKLSVFEHGPSSDLLWRRLRPYIVDNLGPLLARGVGGGECTSTTAATTASFKRQHEPVVAAGLNPRLRVLKYDAVDDDRFEPHYDATTTLSSVLPGGNNSAQQQKQTSLLTVLLYLNEEFDGGQTRFLNASTTTTITSTTNAACNDAAANQCCVIKPQLGMCVIFEHDLYHQSTPLLWGSKYVLRTDVMFHHEDYLHLVDMQQQQQQTTTTTTPSNENSNEGGDKHNDNTESLSTAVATTTTTSSSITTMVQLCRHLGLLSTFGSVLDGMGLLDCTIEAFCTPGKDRLSLMMRQEMMTASTAASVANQDDLAGQHQLDALIDTAFSIHLDEKKIESLFN